MNGHWREEISNFQGSDREYINANAKVTTSYFVVLRYTIISSCNFFSRIHYPHLINTRDGHRLAWRVKNLVNNE